MREICRVICIATADDRYIAREDIQSRRQIVNPGLVQKATNRRLTGAPIPHGALRVMLGAAELDREKASAVVSKSGLAHEHRPVAVQLDRQSDQHNERQGEHDRAKTMRPCEDAHRESRLNPALAAALISALSALCWVRARPLAHPLHGLPLGGNR
jgi:hypothetical protein